MSDSNDELMMETMYWWGIPTLFRCEHNKNISECDIALAGVPHSTGNGTTERDQHLGPRAVRHVSAGLRRVHLDFNINPWKKKKIFDLGDVALPHANNNERCIEDITNFYTKIANDKKPVVSIGGDHSINIPIVNAFSDEAPFHIIQIDAHLDFVDIRHGVKYGHGNPMRRAIEKPYVTGLTQIGIRNVSSTAREGYVDARTMGSDIISVRQQRKLGAIKTIERISGNKKVYVTIDIDAFCPSIAPGTGTPSHGGFLYYEVLEMLQEISKKHEVIGIDLVEVAPDYDQSGSTSILAAQLLMNFIGFIFHNK